MDINFLRSFRRTVFLLGELPFCPSVLLGTMNVLFWLIVVPGKALAGSRSEGLE